MELLDVRPLPRSCAGVMIDIINVTVRINTLFPSAHQSYSKYDDTLN